MKATDRFIRTLVSKYNEIRKQINLPSCTLSVLQFDSGKQHRHRYALKNNDSYITPYIPGNTMVYYLQGILTGHSLNQEQGEL